MLTLFGRKLSGWPSVFVLMLLAASAVSSVAWAAVPKEPNTIIVSAEGLADPTADTYKRDKGLMIDALRADARRQAIEKAVGIYVESSTLVQNYVLINDKVMTKSKGLIKRIIKETSPQLGKDGLMHMFIKAEVVLSDIKEALKGMSKSSRLSLIREHGNPTISVAVVVRDAKRGSDVAPENSPIAENILKEHFSTFGYRVWSEDYTKLLNKELTGKTTSRRVADFSVIGEAKFKQASVTLRASGLTLTKHVLTSWTVKSIDNHTGEEIYFNNKVPRNKSWADEDAALADIGKLIGNEFSQDFFEDQLLKPSKIIQVQMRGLPDYDTGLMFKKEMIGLRPILNVDLRTFDAGGLTVYEIDFAGSSGNFMQIINNTIINPLNGKLGKKSFKFKSHHGDVVLIDFKSSDSPEKIRHTLESMPPASLVNAAPERIKELIHSDATMEKLIAMNPSLEQAIKKVAEPTSTQGSMSEMQNF
ncbi:MAG: hypothetical protein KAI75_07395 [Desulfobulbaceae bacterium]|nr:hypothetical protein [Desulfobulbaceae bacterium]